MAIDLIVPKLGESIVEATVAKWLKQVGDSVATDEPVVDLETDKVTISLPAPSGGVLTEQKFAVGSVVKVGESVGSITAGAATTKPTAAAAKSPPAAAAAVAPSTPTSPISAAPTATSSSSTSANAPHRTLPPSVRKAIREGSSNGNGSVVATAPVVTTTASTAPTYAQPTAPATAPISAPAPSTALVPSGNREDVVPMTPLRKRIAERLVQAQHTAAILTTFNEVDMTHVMELRVRYQEAFTKKHGVKLGFMSFFARAAVESLKSYPGLNAEIRDSNIVYKRHYDFGIAVGSGKGLVVPVIRDVDGMGFGQIEIAIAKMAEKAKANTLTLDDLTGGTFSITNGGIYGSMMSTPLLNLPQTGILGMHNIVKRAIVVNDEIQIRPMMYLALSYDHRVADGREAVQFLVGIKERLESPERMMLEI